MEPLASIAALSSAVVIVLVIAVLLVGLWLPAGSRPRRATATSTSVPTRHSSTAWNAFS